MANKQFDDSVEATEFMETLYDMLNDERLENWAEDTDCNHSTTTHQTLKIVKAKYGDFVNEMYEAGE